jgi:thymidylate kinase
MRFEGSSKGGFVVLVGPDGVGKTSVADALVSMHDGRAAYIHFRPAIWSPLDSDSGAAVSVPMPKHHGSGSRLVGWVRLAWSFLAFWAGYLWRVRPAVRAGRLVVADRWGYGYFAQPTALRFHGPEWLAHMFVSALPAPDLVANLVAAPDVILARKQELTRDQVIGELEKWKRLPVRGRVDFDTSRDPASTAAAICGRLEGMGP